MDLSDPGIKPGSPALQADFFFFFFFFTIWATREANDISKDMNLSTKKHSISKDFGDVLECPKSRDASNDF